jgi:hypothetical protein
MSKTITFQYPLLMVYISDKTKMQGIVAITNTCEQGRKGGTLSDE